MTPRPSATSAQPSPPHVWALASGKGGVGKSLLAANLACLLAEGECPTTVVDLDLTGANLHTFLGVSGEGPGLMDWLAGRAELGSLVCGTEVPGLSFVRGMAQPPLKGWSAATRRRLIRELQRLPARVVILDLGAGASEGVLDFFLAAQLPIVVVVPEPAAIENTHRFLGQAWLTRLSGVARREGRSGLVRQALAQVSPPWRPADVLARLSVLDRAWALGLPGRLAFGPVGLVLNQVRRPADLEVGFDLVAATSVGFSLRMRLLGAVDEDPSVWLAHRRRQLVVRQVREEILSRGLTGVAEHGVEGGELAPLVDADQA